MKSTGNHAMLVTGYDDSVAGGAFELMNSWGSYWANNGFVWIPYSDMAQYTFEAYEITENPSLYSNTFSFDAKIELILHNGEKMPVTLVSDGIYRVEQSYNSGTMFQVLITSKNDSYMYAFSSDKETGKTNVIFPYSENISPLLNYNTNVVVCPSEDYYIQMDDITGTDYLIIMFSKKPLSISEICRTYERSGGTLPKTNPLNSNYSEQSIQFSAKTNNISDIFSLMIYIPHN